MMAWYLNVLIALDQLANAIFGGWPDETLSARSWRCRTTMPYAALYRLIDVLFFNPAHCQTAYEEDCKHLYMPPEER